MADRLNSEIAIIGGGWAGLAAAVTLADAGKHVHLFESAKQLGGRSRSVNWDGLTIDNGQHLMAGAYRQTFALMDRLDTLGLLERRRLDLRGPGFQLTLPKLPAPFHLVAGLISARGLSLADKWAAVRFMQALKRRHFRLDHDITASTLLATYLQPGELVDRLWEPICVAALNTPLAMASAQVFCNVLRDSLAGAREDSDFLFNRSAMGRLLPEAAQRFLTERGSSVQLSSRVDGLRLEDGRFILGGPDAVSDRLIIATHPSQTPALLAGVDAAAAIAAKLRQFSWQPIFTLYLRFASPIAFPYPMLALDHGAAFWAFERNDLAPGLVAIVASAEGPHLQQTPESLRDELLQKLATDLGPLPPLLNWKAINEKRATFACTPNLDRPGNATPVPGLYLAGDYTAGDYPATLEGAVRSGVECARLILERT
ncbi:MAG: hydroxysqualene dehydroxylase HpnE [Parasulfuritortus sp.]|nr:hydroxysqualene dehydroxylase HpnE [Parasulfuritortus sp.]